MEIENFNLILGLSLSFMTSIILVTAFVAMKYWGPDRLEDRESHK